MGEKARKRRSAHFYYLGPPDEGSQDMPSLRSGACVLRGCGVRFSMEMYSHETRIDSQ
jgi:hypothetical protein